MKKLLLLSISLGMMVLLSGCDAYDYPDSLKIENGKIVCSSQSYDFDLDLAFELISNDLFYKDTLALDDVVAISNEGFKVERKELISKRYAGNYEIRKYRYQANFILYLNWYVQMGMHYLPFEFMAEEVWLNDVALITQPFKFEVKGSRNSDDLHKFTIKAKQRYNNQIVDEFVYLYQVVRGDFYSFEWQPYPDDENITITIRVI